MINLEDKKQCCGCTACRTICPMNAIEMQADKMGFLYPIVDLSNCIDCGLCERVCAFNSGYDRSKLYDSPLVFGAYNRDTEQVVRSQSGGLFYTLASYIISIGGVVYGAAFENVFKVSHIRVSTLFDLESLRGSKYVQSDLGFVFNNVIDDLLSGITVLFSGTSCQIAGLHSLIKSNRIDDSNLFLCDIICHGVPSPNVWKENLRHIESQYKSKIIKAIFRDKKLFGWHSSISSFILENGKTVSSNKFNLAFGLGYINRQSCSICYFANMKRPSDITLGDFWGLSKVNPQLDAQNKGVSLVLINSEKGETLFDSIKDELICFESNVIDCIQPNLEKPNKPSPNRGDFEQLFLTKGYYKALQSFSELRAMSTLSRVKSYFIRTIEKLLG